MKMSFHMSQSITGPLTNWSDSDWVGALNWITKDDGSRYSSATELRAKFVSLLQDGWLVAPIGECCNFDKKRGCMGHAEPEHP